MTPLPGYKNGAYWNPELDANLVVQIRIPDPGVTFSQGLTLIVRGADGKVVYRRVFNESIADKINIELPPITDGTQSMIGNGVYLILVKENLNKKTIGIGKLAVFR